MFSEPTIRRAAVEFVNGQRTARELRRAMAEQDACKKRGSTPAHRLLAQINLVLDEHSSHHLSDEELRDELIKILENDVNLLPSWAVPPDTTFLEIRFESVDFYRREMRHDFATF